MSENPILGENSGLDLVEVSNNSFEKYNHKRNRSFLQVSNNDSKEMGLAKDNRCYNEFTLEYNKKLMKAFNEAEKVTSNDHFK
jgi:hypothetical protein